jgi:hypothetical protein
MDPWLNEPMSRRSLVALIYRADPTLHMPVSAVKIALGAATSLSAAATGSGCMGVRFNVHIQFSKRLFVFAEHGIQEFSVRLCIQHRQQRL